MPRKTPKSQVVAFKVEEDLADFLNKLPNKSAFIRKSIVAQLGMTCPLCTGRPTTFTGELCGAPDSASVIDDSYTETSDAWQSVSASWPGPVWYQITETLPLSPAAIHGQNTRAFFGDATVIGFDQVAPRSLV